MINTDMENINFKKEINKWFKMKYKTYSKLETDDSIYLYYEGQEYADIRIDKKSKDIYYRRKLYEEFSEIIPLYYREFEKFMNKWVEDTFNLMGFTSFRISFMSSSLLKIPKLTN